MFVIKTMDLYFEINGCTMTYSGRLGDWYTGLGTRTLAPKTHFSSFFFFLLYSNKKDVEVAINDITKHLIILKWLIIQKY